MVFENAREPWLTKRLKKTKIDKNSKQDALTRRR